MKHKTVRVLATFLTLVALAAAGAFLYWRMQIQAEEDQARETALTKAIEVAKFYGMETEQPDAFVIKKTTYAEWYAITGSGAGTDAARFGLGPDRPIWIVAMIITGTFSGPGIPGMTRPKIDNISIVITADTYQEGAVSIVDATQPLPLSLQRE